MGAINFITSTTFVVAIAFIIVIIITIIIIIRGIGILIRKWLNNRDWHMMNL